ASCLQFIDRLVRARKQRDAGFAKRVKVDGHPNTDVMRQSRRLRAPLLEENAEDLPARLSETNALRLVTAAIRPENLEPRFDLLAQLLRRQRVQLARELPGNGNQQFLARAIAQDRVVEIDQHRARQWRERSHGRTMALPVRAAQARPTWRSPDG